MYIYSRYYSPSQTLPCSHYIYNINKRNIHVHVKVNRSISRNRLIKCTCMPACMDTVLQYPAKRSSNAKYQSLLNFSSKILNTL